MVFKDVTKQQDDHHHIIAEICNGEKKSLELLQKNKEIHWSSIRTNRTKETPLHLAAQYGHIDIISYLLTDFHPKIVDIRNVDNKTPLHVASQFGRLDCVKMLVENGADINAIKRSDWTPLMLACTKPEQVYEEIVEYLIDNGALLNFKNKDGWTCLHLASRNENPSILQVLAGNNIDFAISTNNGRTALHIAALHGNLQNVKVLVSKIDVNSEDSSGNTPLHEAVLGGSIEIVDFLVSKEANITTINKTRSNVLHLAAANGSISILKHLIQNYRIDLNETNLNGHTGLHCAAKKKDSDTFNLLVELGADTEILDKTGRRAREYLL